MDIVIVADFCGSFLESDNNRFVYLANLLAETHNVELVTSDFHHQSKNYFENIPDIIKKYKFNITFLHEPRYVKNISMRRFYSHYIWGKNVKKYLATRVKPDAIYSAVPVLTASYNTADFCKKNGINYIVDIQDLWPEAFKMALNVPIVSDIAFAPFMYLANYSYKNADAIIAVSDSYVERARRVNKKAQYEQSIYLGTELSLYDFNSSIPNKFGYKKRDDELWLGYCGSLGDSYDIGCVIRALHIVKEKSVNTPKFIIMGEGEKHKEFQDLANELDVECIFTGNVPYGDMCNILSQCDMVVNPIVGRSAASIINKHGDYAASGKAVLNTQNSDEYKRLVDEFEMGLNSESGDSKALAKNILTLINDENLRIKMGNNSRRCAEKLFDRAQTYRKVNDILEKL